MNFFPTSIPEIIRVEPQVFGDARGFFMETYRDDKMVATGISGNFVQDNQSGSHRNILRGLHYQIRQAQGKLVRAVSGEIFDVAVDLRRSSPTFGLWTGEILSVENKRMLWIPPRDLRTAFMSSATGLMSCTKPRNIIRQNGNGP